MGQFNFQQMQQQHQQVQQSPSSILQPKLTTPVAAQTPTSQVPNHPRLFPAC